MSAPENHSGLAAFKHLDFSLYEVERFLVVAAVEMQSVAVGWQVYEITRRPLDLGLVGLAQFLPNIILFLLAGHTADRFNRKKVLLLCNVGFALCSALLIVIAHFEPRDVKAIYAVLVVLGVLRGFNSSVGRSWISVLVSAEVLPLSLA